MHDLAPPLCPNNNACACKEVCCRFLTVERSTQVRQCGDEVQVIVYPCIYLPVLPITILLAAIVFEWHQLEYSCSEVMSGAASAPRVEEIVLDRSGGIGA